MTHDTGHAPDAGARGDRPEPPREGGAGGRAGAVVRRVRDAGTDAFGLPPDDLDGGAGGLQLALGLLQARAAAGVALAQLLVGEPDLAILDEPTNHLDLATIEWLEEYLLAQIDTLFFVSHDRTFVRKLATRVIEIDRGQLYDWGCDYDTFLLRKKDALEQEARGWQEFDKTLAQEETWIRRGTQVDRADADQTGALPGGDSYPGAGCEAFP